MFIKLINKYLLLYWMILYFGFLLIILILKSKIYYVYFIGFIWLLIIFLVLLIVFLILFMDFFVVFLIIFILLLILCFI